jgi:hypothetical protein
MSDCRHATVGTLRSEDDTVRVWACDECGRRFYPACPTCVTVGHRGETHPGPEPGAGLSWRASEWWPPAWTGTGEPPTPPTEGAER